MTEKKGTLNRVAARTVDGFRNLAARVGRGAGSQHDDSYYAQDHISKNRQQLEAMYRTSWLAGMAVDTVGLAGLGLRHICDQLVGRFTTQ